MSRETEKFFREFQKYAATQHIESEEALQAALESFTAQQSDGTNDKPDEPDAYDYLDMAYNAQSKKKAAEYAQKALDLEPELLDAEYLLVSLHAKADSAYQAELESLLKKGEMQLRGKGITREKDAGEYYTLHETRPYLRVYQAYIDLLIAEGKLRKAVEACKDVLYLNEGDNMGIRYTLMVLYALLEDRDSGEKLYQDYPEESSFMLLPFIALYYRLDDTVKAAEWLTILTGRMKGVKTALKQLLKMDQYETDRLLHIPYYSPFSTEELQLAYVSYDSLYGTMPDFVPWLIANLPQTGSAKKGRH
jgi:hypothetical protein